MKGLNEILQVGKNMHGFKKGDRVISLKNHCNYAICLTEPLKIPDEVSYENAAFCPLGSVTLRGIRRSGSLKG